MAVYFSYWIHSPDIQFNTFTVNMQWTLSLTTDLKKIHYPVQTVDLNQVIYMLIARVQIMFYHRTHCSFQYSAKSATLVLDYSKQVPFCWSLQAFQRMQNEPTN